MHKIQPSVHSPAFRRAELKRCFMNARSFLALLLLATIFSGCIHAPGSYLVLQPTASFNASGGGAFLKSPLDLMQFMGFHESAAVYLQPRFCNAHCGIHFQVHYTSTTTSDELRGFVEVIIRQASIYRARLTVQLSLDDRPRGVPLYAEVYIGEVTYQQ